jgi:uncharacterized protein
LGKSAGKPNNGEKAMAEGRNEPSMDEILSSIKKIIAEEDRTKTAARKRSTPRSAAQSADENSAEDTEILELTEVEEPRDDAEALLDDSKAQTLSDPGVAPQIVRSGETSLEGLTRELLKPMLKSWLDNHLPALVEAMVEREIERITKKS